MPESATQAPQHRPLDDETAAALTLFNTYLVADREQRARERALKRAEKAKDDAAAAVRKLNDRKAPAAEMAEAETRYREAAEALQRLRDGDSSAPDDQSDHRGADTAATSGDEDTPGEHTEDADGDEDTPGEQTGDADGDEDTPGEQTGDADGETADETSSVRVEASVGDEDLAGDEPAGVAG